MARWLTFAFAALAVSAPHLADAEEQCDASADGSCAAAGSQPSAQRVVLDKTPTPCQKTYPDDVVQKAVMAHIANASTGHAVPHLLMLLGGSGAGKGTFVKHVKKYGFKADDFVFHGLDEYLIYLPGFVESVSNPTAVYKDAADDCYGGAIAIAKAAQESIIAKRQHVIYEETGKNLERILKRVLPPFEAAGYRVTAVLVDNHPDVAKVRAADRFQKEGRYASDEYIEGTFRNVPANYKALLATGRVHESAYCDNSCMQGGANSPADAAKLFGCLRCWRDTLPVPGSVSVHPAERFGDAPLVLDAALESGDPMYLDASPGR